MAYLSLYRKYRSQSFDELVGQEHITTVLKNSLAQGRIAHAYLFCGPRGCGKTSTARLLARALNCTSSPGPTPNPCGTCEMCVRIRDGHAIDVVEMDAASETGIDDVREKIIENAQYRPTEARYKVYIIDEVHDLSQKAFDSLLKTIEEPPPHVVFVLATTEAHKVPVTIRSRCQRMDFRRGTLDDLEKNLRRVADAEKLEYDLEALALIARAAEGSYRDSLSLLEQVMAVADGRITVDSVRLAIGAVTGEMLQRLVEAVLSGDLLRVHLACQDVLSSGADARQLIISLQEYLRDAVLLHYADTEARNTLLSGDRREALAHITPRLSPDVALRMLQVLAEAERDLRFTNQQRLVIERTLWRLTDVTAGLTREVSHAAPAPVIRRTPDTQPAAAPAAAPVPPPIRRTETATVAQPPSPSPVPPPATEVTLEEMQRLWPRVRARIVHRYRSAQSVLTEEVKVVALEGKTVVLEFPNDFMRERVERPEAKQRIEEALAAELKLEGYRIRCRVRVQDAPAAVPSPIQASAPTQDRPRSLLDDVAEIMDAEAVEPTDGETL